MCARLSILAACSGLGGRKVLVRARLRECGECERAVGRAPWRGGGGRALLRASHLACPCMHTCRRGRLGRMGESGRGGRVVSKARCVRGGGRRGEQRGTSSLLAEQGGEGPPPAFGPSGRSRPGERSSTCRALALLLARLGRTPTANRRAWPGSASEIDGRTSLAGGGATGGRPTKPACLPRPPRRSAIPRTLPRLSRVCGGFRRCLRHGRAS